MKNRVLLISLATVLALSMGLSGCGGGEVPEYSLTVYSTEGGEVTNPGELTSSYDEGAEVPLVALPHAGYRFVDWTGDVGTVANVNAASTTITMNGNCSITANFVAQYVLTIDSTDDGEVTTPGEGTFTYDEGTVVVLGASPDTGYRFVSWSGDVSTVSDVNRSVATITLHSDCTVSASFEEKIDYPYSGSVRLHTGSDSQEYTWSSFVPDDLKRSSTYHILLVTEGGFFNYEDTIESIRGLAGFFSWNPSLSDLISDLICIGVALPRDECQGAYTAAMPAKVFSDVIDKRFYRPDLKVSAIIEDFTSEMESYGIQVHDKVLMWGFSNSAMFAQRYCFLHPEKVKAIAVGQAGGGLTMGIDIYSGNELDWPVGTSDFSILTSVDFDVNAYNSIPKFIFIGEEDYNSAVITPPHVCNTNIFSVEQCEILYDIADTDPIRVQKQSVIMNNNGDNITFKMYPGVAHEFCSEMQYDVGAFFSNIVEG